MVHVSHHNAVSLNGAVHFSFDSVPQQWRKVSTVEGKVMHDPQVMYVLSDASHMVCFTILKMTEWLDMCLICQTFWELPF